METLAGMPYWELDFDEHGGLAGGASDALVHELAENGVRDLFVLAHGWNTGRADADALYGDLVPRIAAMSASAPAIEHAGFVGIYWPAVWFPDRPSTDAEAGAGVGSALSTDDAGTGPPRSSGDDAWSGTDIAGALESAFPADDDRRALVRQLGALIDAGMAGSGAEPDDVQKDRLQEFHDVLQRLVPRDVDVIAEDRGELTVLASADPLTSYAKAAQAFGVAAPTGDAQLLGVDFRTAWHGAKEALRVFSYWAMKARAGTIGRTGLGPLLERAGAAGTALRVHLVGHSFGARLVSFTLAGMSSADASPVSSLVLVQGAFSHWSFAGAADNPFGPGALWGYADRVHGPLVATYSTWDWAVGRWYPRASALARDDSTTVVIDRWGAMGADGFCAVEPLEQRSLLPPADPYAFTAGSFYRVDGSGVIKDWRQSRFAGAHSDIKHDEVAWLVAAAAADAPGRP